MSEGRARGSWSRPLRVHLSAVIALLLIGVATPLIWFSYESGRDAAKVGATAQMSALADRIVDRYRTLFSEAQSSVGLIAASSTFLTPPSLHDGSKSALLLKALRLSIYLDGIYAGYADGSFIHAVNLEDQPAWREVIGAPAWASYAVRFNAPGEVETRETRWRFVDTDFKRSELGEPGSTGYDPRVRPWYRMAVDANGPIVTPPYVTATTKALAVTVSESHRLDPKVVIGADVLLDRLSRFLAEERISGRATSYVFDPSRRVMVHSDPEVMSALLGKINSIPEAEAAAVAALDPVYGPVLGLLARDPAAGIEVEVPVGGDDYLVRIVRIRDGTMLDGTTIAVAAPVADFMGPSERFLRQSLTVSVALLVIGVAIAFLISQLVSRSLTRLTGEAERLAAFDFTLPPPLKTRISEISALDDALDHAREAIRAFGLYVPRELVRRIFQSGQHESRSAVREDVTVMFTDIRDFTTISERNPPEAVVEMLSRYFEVINRCIEGNRGTIVTFLGDSVYAMWNAPTRDPDHVADACACALQVEAALSDLNAAQRAAGQPEFVTRFGIHSGPAVTGSVGAEDRLQYTAMGDTVNVASRLEGLNKEFGTTILASRAVADRCAGRFTFRPLGATIVKGRAEPVEVFELAGPAG